MMSQHSKITNTLMVPALVLGVAFSSAAWADRDDRGNDRNRDYSQRYDRRDDRRDDRHFAPPPVRRDWSQAQRNFDGYRHDNRPDYRPDNRYDNRGRVIVIPPRPVYREPYSYGYVVPPVIVPAPVYCDYGYGYRYNEPRVCLNIGDRNFNLNLCN
ncbi:MAG: hypothetical protein PHX61_02075 [Alphaproteobacteria bacterium]|nr:hypothetical protein [Alphaproteobacteria bacterium]